MHKSNPTMSSGNPDGSAMKEHGAATPWSLAETLDAYEVEELTPAQAAKLLREAGPSRRSPRLQA